MRRRLRLCIKQAPVRLSDASPGPPLSQSEPPRGRRDNVVRFRRPEEPPPRQRHEPAFNAPWPPVALAALLVGLYAVQSLIGTSDTLLLRFGLIPALVLRGAWWTPLTSLFLHGFWMHAILNAVAVLAFGAPVARFLGERGTGPLRFLGFFLGCGVLAGLGYVALNSGSAAVLVGASGGAAGLMAAASRLFNHAYQLAGLRDRQVLIFAGGFVLLNLLFALFGFAPGAEGVPVAWQAHLIGYAVGLFGIAPFARLTRAR